MNLEAIETVKWILCFAFAGFLLALVGAIRAIRKDKKADIVFYEWATLVSGLVFGGLLIAIIDALMQVVSRK